VFSQRARKTDVIFPPISLRGLPIRRATVFGVVDSCLGVSWGAELFPRCSRLLTLVRVTLVGECDGWHSDLL